MATNISDREDRLQRLDQPFDQMFAAEIDDWISKLPKNEDKEFKSPHHPDPGNELVGIAMSGGGMRSATYNLGVAQALANGGLMEEVDYMSTVSGGGYFGTSLTSLCLEDLPYNDNWDAHLDMTKDRFPYAFPGPLRPPSESVSVHGLESPATRHVRERSKLITPKLGLFQTEMWTALSRYLASTVALWLLYLLPSVTAVLLLTLLIPNEVWVRFDPLGTGGSDSWLGRNLWAWTIPLWFLGGVAILAVFTGGDTRTGDQFARDWVKRSQSFLLVVGAISGGAVLLGLALWGFNFAINDPGADQIIQSVLGALGVSGAAAFTIGGRKIMVPERAKQLLWKLLFGIGGFIILGIGLVAWDYYLFLWLAEPQLNQTLSEGFGIYWGGYGLAWDGVVLAWVITGIFGYHLLNALSLNRIYERRLRRSWIVGAKPPYPPGSGGVSVPQQGWSRVWVRPDIKMSDLNRNRVFSPYPLICTALNIPGSTGPKLLDRKADSFVIGPVYSGSALTRWRPTEELPEIASMPLAKAATISAAAVSPNMGKVTQRTLSILTTLFNLRLGWWVPNPRPSSRLSRFLQRPTVLYWTEMLGIASHRDPVVYLSDGGHFENLGMYELLRRRCKFIVAVDCSGEPSDRKAELHFEGLAELVRRTRIDFGIDIDIDVRPLMRNPETGQVKSHFAVGRIRYPTESGHGAGNPSEESTGILVYIKPGRVEGQQPPDIINYTRQIDPAFPHDPTADQQFDSAQFESYRELGFSAGRAVIAATGDQTGARARFLELYDWYQSLLHDLEFSKPSASC